jgi:hypothetical protein
VKHGFGEKVEGKFAIAKKGKKMKSGIFIYWVRTHWLGVMLIEKFNHMGWLES